MDKNKLLQIILIALAALITVGFIFIIGVSVGHRKARFSERFAANYERNFLGPRPGPGLMRNFIGNGFRNGYTVSGDLIKIENEKLTIKDKRGEENITTVTDKTIINHLDQKIKTSDLKIDDKLIVIGRPGDEGSIEARLIRVFR